MTVSAMLQKMIDYSEGNLHDINHLIKVWAYAKTIGQLEGLDTETQLVLEVAAITHDIACPLCREKYGNTAGKHQEREGVVLAAEFLQDAGLTQAQTDRVLYLIGHHHTFHGVDGLDYQILVEADYLVNADESAYNAQSIKNILNRYFKTESGKALLRSVHRV